MLALLPKVWIAGALLVGFASVQEVEWLRTFRTLC